MHRIAHITALALTLAFNASTALAQDFPSRAIKLVVPYSAGGLPDVMARIIAQRVTESIGQPVLVENLPGAGGIGGTETVVKAAADGYTLLVTDGSQLTVNPHLYSKLSYDPVKTLTPVSLVGAAPLFMAVNTSVPAKTLAELIALAKSKPGQLNYGSPGIGSMPHLSVEALKAAVGIDTQHIPYKGSQQSVQALLAGDITFSMVALGSVAAQMAAGRVRLLAISAPTRSAQLPDIPTFIELGIADFNFQPRIGIVAPARTPAAIIAKLSAEIAKASKHPDTVQRFNAVNIEAVGSTPEAYAAIIRADYERNGRIVKLSGAKAE